MRAPFANWLPSQDKTDAELIAIGKSFDSIYFNSSTYICALLSAGSAIDTCLAVVEGKVKNAIAVIRPPGHHAERDRSMGFCHFDNVSIATNAVRQRHPEIRKVLILDWDVHHGEVQHRNRLHPLQSSHLFPSGNGIQQAFESDPDVLYISIHVHQNGNFYPSGPYGNHLHCGIGPGLGKHVCLSSSRWPVLTRPEILIYLGVRRAWAMQTISLRSSML
jgi:histone deacetylase 6